VVEGCCRARFLFESNPPIDVARNGRGENLDGDVTSKPGITGPINLTHRPGADRRDNLVRPESGAWCQ